MRPTLVFVSAGAVAIAGIAALGVDAVLRQRSPGAAVVADEGAAARPASALDPGEVHAPKVRRAALPVAVAAAPPASEVESEPPVDEGESAAKQYELEQAFSSEPRDTVWADAVERRIHGLFASERLAPDFEKTVECRSTLCRVDIATTAMIALENLGAFQRALGNLTIFTTVRSDGSPHLVAFTEAPAPRAAAH